MSISSIEIYRLVLYRFVCCSVLNKKIQLTMYVEVLVSKSLDAGSIPATSTSLRFERSEKRRMHRRSADLSERSRAYINIFRSKLRLGKPKHFYYINIYKLRFERSEKRRMHRRSRRRSCAHTNLCVRKFAQNFALSGKIISGQNVSLCLYFKKHFTQR